MSFSLWLSFKIFSFSFVFSIFNVIYSSVFYLGVFIQLIFLWDWSVVWCLSLNLEYSQSFFLRIFLQLFSHSSSGIPVMHLLDHLILPHSSWIPFSGFCFSFISLCFSLHCFKFRGSFLFVLPLLMNFLKIFITVSVFLISGIYIWFFLIVFICLVKYQLILYVVCLFSLDPLHINLHVIFLFLFNICVIPVSDSDDCFACIFVCFVIFLLKLGMLYWVKCFLFLVMSMSTGMPLLLLGLQFGCLCWSSKEVSWDWSSLLESPSVNNRFQVT